MNAAQIKSYLAKIPLPCDLAQLPETAYLVGGSVRDALLGRYKTPIDLDFVLPQGAIATARKIANLYGAGFVVLDQEREIARVVFDQGTLDLARQEGASLDDDLNRRDFTINSLAYNIRQQKLVDSLGGFEDLQQGVLRMVSPQNLEDDPLRLLRAYRQAAQLNFEIETDTRSAICDRTSLLKTVAGERVQAELNYILAAPQGSKWLTAAIKDGLFRFWLSYAGQVDRDQLSAIVRGVEYCRDIGFAQSELPLMANLATLVTPELTIAEAELKQLKYARAIIKAVTKTVKLLPTLQQMTGYMSLREQYHWFLEVKDIFPILIARAIATGVASEIIQPLIERYLDPADLVAHPQSLVTGNDLINRLNLPPSPLIGKLLTEIQIAQIENKISTPQQAIDFAHSMLPSSSQQHSSMSNEQ
ncbi:MAG: CCA tRNA nucleotidyltransferase [Cyanobacteria bacterium J06642_3]